VVQQFLDAHANRFDSLISGDPGRAATKLLSSMAQREALVLTYNDVLLLLGALFVCGLMQLPLVRRPRSFLAHCQESQCGRKTYGPGRGSQGDHCRR
jgi:hypothetical protein